MYTIPNDDLLRAARSGNLERAKKALSEGADPNYMDNDPVLQLAIMRNHVDIVNLLLNNGADVNLKKADGITPLIQARTGEMVRFLLARGADPKIDDGGGLTAADYFVSYDNLDALKAWLELGLPMRRITKKKLNWLLSKCRFDMITFLTGFGFSNGHTLAKMAEFKAKYKYPKATQTKRGA